MACPLSCQAWLFRNSFVLKMLIHVHILLWIKVGFFLPGFSTRQFVEPLSLCHSAQDPGDSCGSPWGDSGSEGHTAGPDAGMPVRKPP